MVRELRERLQDVEKAADQVKISDASVTSESTMKCNEIRMFANLDQSVKVFTGSESNYDAADWIQSVENIADLNAWPVAYRMQFVRCNMTEAAETGFCIKSSLTGATSSNDFGLHSCGKCYSQIVGTH